MLSAPQPRVAQPRPDPIFSLDYWPQGVRQQPSMVKPPLQLSMPLCADGHQNPVLIQVLLRVLWLCMNCSGGRKAAGHQFRELGVILELLNMKTLPKRSLHEKGRQYSLAVRWVHLAGGAARPARCPRNLQL